jgi:hypothetical protein
MNLESSLKVISKFKGKVLDTSAHRFPDSSMTRIPSVKEELKVSDRQDS